MRFYWVSGSGWSVNLTMEQWRLLVLRSQCRISYRRSVVLQTLGHGADIHWHAWVREDKRPPAGLETCLKALFKDRGLL